MSQSLNNSEGSVVLGSLCHPEELLTTIYGEKFADWQAGGYPLPPAEVIERDMPKLAMITGLGQALMNRRHGTGYPDYQFFSGDPEAVKNLGYNNGEHAASFRDDIKLLREVQDAHNSTNKALSSCLAASEQTAAVWHDIVQKTVIEGLPRTGADEADSARQMLQVMHRHGVHPFFAFSAGFVVQGTQLLTSDTGAILGQHGGANWKGVLLNPDNTYPNDIARQSARNGSAADLGRLYSWLSPLKSRMLLVQQKGLEPYDAAQVDNSFDTIKPSIIGQQTFLENYKYPVGTCAESVFAGDKRLVIAYGRLIIDAVQSGAISSFTDVIAHDKLFAQEGPEYLRKLNFKFTTVV